MKHSFKLFARNISAINKLLIFSLLFCLPQKAPAMDIGEASAVTTFSTSYYKGDFDAKKDLADEANAESLAENNEKNAEKSLDSEAKQNNTKE